MAITNNLLFVYGSLMSTFNNPFSMVLQQNATLIEKGFLKAKLYNVGSYPAAVLEFDSSQKVIGEIWEIIDFEKTITYLDDYEGLFEPQPEYRRELVQISTTKNKTLECWVYLYNLNTNNLKLIPNGNYLEWITNKIQQ